MNLGAKLGNPLHINNTQNSAFTDASLWLSYSLLMRTITYYNYSKSLSSWEQYLLMGRGLQVADAPLLRIEVVGAGAQIVYEPKRMSLVAHNGVATRGINCY